MRIRIYRRYPWRIVAKLTFVLLEMDLVGCAEKSAHVCFDCSYRRRSLRRFDSAVRLRRLNGDIVDGSEIPFPTTVWMFLKPCKK